jgi:hypothetical protein
MAEGIHISGVRKAEAAIEEMIQKMRFAGYRITLEGAQVIIKNSRKQFTTVGIDSAGNERVLTKGTRLRKGEKISRRGRHVEGNQPHIRSGYLARSIQFEGPRELSKGRWETTIGPKAAYGRRIELGFRGKDSLGRTYDQGPLPYMAPGLEESRYEVEAIAKREWERAMA